MSRWPMVPLGEVMSPRMPDTTVDPNCHYTFAGVYSFGRGLFRGVTRRGADISYRKLTRLNLGEFTYPKLMAWEGSVGLVTCECDGCFVSPEYPVFRIDASRAVPKFMDYFLRQPNAIDLFRGASAGTNMRRRRLHPNSFLRLSIPLPPPPEQRRIVAQLDAVAERLTRRRKETQVVEAALAASLRAAFDRLTADAPRVRLGDVAPLVRRAVGIDLEGSYPELGIRSFGKGTFHKPSIGGIEVGTKRLFEIKEGDLLFNIVFAWEGAVAIATADDHGRFGSHRFLTCVPDADRATAQFLRYYFLSSQGLQRLGEASPGGAGRNRTLGLRPLEAIEVPLPSLDAQRWFDALQAKATAVRRGHAAVAAELAHLLPALLHREFG